MGKSLSKIKYPLVCICVPVRNGSTTIRETLNSLIKQDYENYEILVCDNLSTDNTRQIVKEVSDNSTVKITYLLNEVKGPAEENWNFLLNNLQTTADYFSIYHADDIYAPTMVSKQVELIERTNVGAVFTQSALIDEYGKNVTKLYNHSITFPKEIRGKEVFDYEDLLHYTLKYHNIIRTPSFFFRRSLLDYDFYFDLSFKSSADLDLWLRIAKISRIAVLNEPLLSYRISRNQGTYSILRNRLELTDFFLVMDKHIKLSLPNDDEVLNRYNAHKSLELIFCAVNLIKAGKIDRAKCFLHQALTVKKFKSVIGINNGLKTFIFGIVLKWLMIFKAEHLIIKIADNFRKF